MKIDPDPDVVNTISAMRMVPACDPEKGLPAGTTERGRQMAQLESLRRLQCDEEWLARPFVPKDLKAFRASAQLRSEREVKTNLGDALRNQKKAGNS